MMYVKNDEEIRKWIAEGSPAAEHEHSDESRAEDGGMRDDHVTGHAEEATGDSGHAGIRMPAFGDLLSQRELDDLVASFKVASGMVRPPAGTGERRGHDLAREWNCFSCHGVAASGGLPNPGSFAGFIPGWYGPDFHELVKNREEFDAWIRSGSIPRIERNPIASHYVRKQRIAMPEYPDLTAAELDDLWSYSLWLAETGGGHEGAPSPW